MNLKKNILAGAVAFFSGAGASGVWAEEAGSEEGLDWLLEEIVVTASRRESSLNDTAVSIAAIGGEEIARKNISEMNDYLRFVPGVNLIELAVGRNGVVTRGLATNPQFEGAISGSTTGIYFGEVPLSGISIVGGSPDIKMIDLERVEVLRGPQGTLFGSGALAGAVRNIPNAPILDELSGSIKTSYSNTADSGGDNTKVEGVLNLPLVDDKLALRAVVYRHDTSGYVDNIAGTALVTGGESRPGVPAATDVAAHGGGEFYIDRGDVGAVEHVGGRIALLWRATDDLDVTLQHVYQDADQDGIPHAQLNTGGYTQVSPSVGDYYAPFAGKEEGYKDEVSISNLVVDYDLGWAGLMSSSSWVDAEGGRLQDISSQQEGRLLGSDSTTDNSAFYQELRLVSQHQGSLQYVVGAYYEDTDIATRTILAGMPAAVARFGAPLGASNPLINDTISYASLEQKSVYGELSYDMTEQLELTLGARRFDYERSNHREGIGLFGPASTNETDETGTSFKANLSYTPNEDALIYLQWAEGFRLGNANGPLPANLCDQNNDGLLDGRNVALGAGFDSDTTENVELGVKLSFLDKRLQVNATVYQMDWDGVPFFIVGLPLPDAAPEDPICRNGQTANVGEVRSKGAELEATYQLTEGLQLKIGGAYTDAEFTGVVPGIGVSLGDRTPSVPEYTYNLGLWYEFDLADNPSYIQGGYAYVDEFYNLIGERGTQGGDYVQANISAGTTVNQFTVELFVNNLTDDDGITYADITGADERIFRLRPRTIGFNVGYQF